MRDPLKAAHVNCNEPALAVRSRRSVKDMAYAAEISFTFFADISNGDNRLSKQQSRFASSPQGPQQGHQTAAIVGNAGHEQCLVFSSQLKGCFTRENGVKVRTNYKWRAAEVLERRYNISDLIS